MTIPTPMADEATIPADDGHHARIWGLDGLAMSASALCLVHCLFLPVVIAFLPTLASWADGGELFHIVMLAIAVPLSGSTLIAGWRRHRAAGPMAIGSVGMGLLGAGLAFEGGRPGTAMTVAGGVVLAVAHLRNVRATMMARLAAG